VTDSNHQQLEDPGQPVSPPHTGHPAVDDALEELASVGSAPLEEHHDRLAKAQEMLQETLNRAAGERSDDDQPG
jgi:hypothetical protein